MTRTPRPDDPVTLPLALAEKLLRLTYSLGDASFEAAVGGEHEFVEPGRVEVIDAELDIVASYAVADRALAERLAELANTLAVELAACVPETVRRRALENGARDRATPRR
jgi:hypothetical protein